MSIDVYIKLICPFVTSLIGPVISVAKDSNVLPLKVAAEHAFMAMFKMGSEGTVLLDVMYSLDVSNR